MKKLKQNWRSHNQNSLQTAVLTWWCQLSGHELHWPDKDKPGRIFLSDHLQPNRADRAELRRSGSLHEVCLTKAYAMLLAQYQPEEKTKDTAEEKAEAETEKKKEAVQLPHDHDERMAVVAWTLAEIRHHQNWYLPKFADHQQSSLGKAMAKSSPGEPPKVSEARFKRLMDVRDRNELSRELMRVIDLLGQSADPLAIACLAYEWDAEWVIRELAKDYYLSQLSSAATAEPT